ncbi:MAG: formate C-acetyltransferase [Elusimicrobia bacterium RIFOXYA2_FULL_39_19]|nr:MAG: formate C-acetyltransferase [Elusimicrobia bacterium RIFOXYA2_FULL_39_19]
MNNNAWRSFIPGVWQETIDLRNFVQKNYKPYTGDETFLKQSTQRTKKLFKKLQGLASLEREMGGVLDIDTSTVSSLTTYPAGYLDKENEIIVGLQTARPLKRSVNPFGGIKMARKACESYGYKLDPKIEEFFSYRTTHNEGVYRVYTDEMKKAKKCGVITGLPDAYGRGRIIGDYRRVPLYGVDELIKQKINDKVKLSKEDMNEETICLTEELYRQVDFLKKLKEMATMYGIDISAPATNAKEAVQWLYFAYLGAIKEQNGAAMSLGRVGTFLDIYFERDLAEGTLTEEGVQEIIDDFVIKLRMARQLRTPEYNELFAGDPLWITESVGGMSLDGRTLVTKTSYRFLQTLYNLEPAPEPNLTVLWSEKLPEPFKFFCSKVSIETNSIQYENDDLMRPDFGDDYAIACCVSAMKIGKQMQFFGARCNLPKMLLLALNGGKDELTGEQIGPEMKPITDDTLNYDEVVKRYNFYRDWLCKLYVNTMNVIHYMHDKYAYEKLQMALHDTKVGRFMAFGVAGLSVVSDSLSAVKYAKVKPLRDKNGLIYNYQVEGDFPKFGNDDEKVDDLAIDLIKDFMASLKKTPAYRNSVHTLSILTITSNVVYGKKTGATPDGRKSGEPFAPGANPMHNRDESGAIASLNSVAKLPYDCCKDGISCTFSVTPSVIGKSLNEQIQNLSSLLDGYFKNNSHHLNVNVLTKETLEDAIANPQKYPFLTIRVSGYAVNFHTLKPEQQNEVIKRTFHKSI